MQSGHRIFADQDRIEIGSAREQESVEAVEQLYEVGIGLAPRRDHYSNATRGFY